MARCRVAHVSQLLLCPKPALLCSPAPAVCSYGIPVVPAYNMSVPLHDAHNGKVMAPGGDIDCIHYCHPGVPEVCELRFIII
jgi:hypothetical protein